MNTSNSVYSLDQADPRFSLKRTVNLLRIDVSFTYNYLLLSLSIPIFILFLNRATNNQAELVELTASMMEAFLWIGGLIFTSYTFKDAHKKLEFFDWAMLPANQLEKFISRLLLTSFVYIGFVIFSFSVIYVAFSLFIGHEVQLLQLFVEAEFSVEYFVIFLFWHAVFLLGSATFKSAAWIKTPMVIFFFLTVIAVVTGKIVGYLSEDTIIPLVESVFGVVADKGKSGVHVTNFEFSNFEYYYWGLATMIPLLWGLAYFQVNRLQAKHAI